MRAVVSAEDAPNGSDDAADKKRKAEMSTTQTTRVSESVFFFLRSVVGCFSEESLFNREDLKKNAIPLFDRGRPRWKV